MTPITQTNLNNTIQNNNTKLSKVNNTDKKLNEISKPVLNKESEKTESNLNRSIRKDPNLLQKQILENMVDKLMKPNDFQNLKIYRFIQFNLLMCFTKLPPESLAKIPYYVGARLALIIEEFEQNYNYKNQSSMNFVKEIEELLFQLKSFCTKNEIEAFKPLIYLSKYPELDHTVSKIYFKSSCSISNSEHCHIESYTFLAQFKELTFELFDFYWKYIDPKREQENEEIPEMKEFFESTNLSELSSRLFKNVKSNTIKEQMLRRHYRKRKIEINETFKIIHESLNNKNKTRKELQDLFLQLLQCFESLQTILHILKHLNEILLDDCLAGYKQLGIGLNYSEPILWKGWDLDYQFDEKSLQKLEALNSLGDIPQKQRKKIPKNVLQAISLFGGLKECGKDNYKNLVKAGLQGNCCVTLEKAFGFCLDLMREYTEEWLEHSLKDKKAQGPWYVRYDHETVVKPKEQPKHSPILNKKTLEETENKVEEVEEKVEIQESSSTTSAPSVDLSSDILLDTVKSLGRKITQTENMNALPTLQNAFFHLQLLGATIGLVRASYEKPEILPTVCFLVIRSCSILIEQIMTAEYLVTRENTSSLTHSHLELEKEVNLIKLFPVEFQNEMQALLMDLDNGTIFHRYPNNIMKFYEKGNVTIPRTLKWLLKPQECKLEDLKSIILSTIRFVEFYEAKDKKADNTLSKQLEKLLDTPPTPIKLQKQKIKSEEFNRLNKQLTTIQQQIKSRKINPTLKIYNEIVTTWKDVSYHLAYIKRVLACMEGLPSVCLLFPLTDALLTMLQFMDEQIETALYMERTGTFLRMHDLALFRKYRNPENLNLEVIHDLNIGVFANYPYLTNLVATDLPRSLKLRMVTMRVSWVGRAFDHGMNPVQKKHRQNKIIPPEKIKKELLSFTSSVIDALALSSKGKKGSPKHVMLSKTFI